MNSSSISGASAVGGGKFQRKKSRKTKPYNRPQASKVSFICFLCLIFFLFKLSKCLSFMKRQVESKIRCLSITGGLNVVETAKLNVLFSSGLGVISM